MGNINSGQLSCSNLDKLGVAEAAEQGRTGELVRPNNFDQYG